MQCLKVILTVFIALAFGVNPLQAKTKELKVLSWNVWHAGHEKAYGQKACDGAIGMLKKSEADVVFMIETYGCSPKVADSLGFYKELISTNLCIYSRYPIVRKFDFSSYIPSFNFGGVEIEVEGMRIRVFNTWLHYLPDMRLVPVEKTEEEILAWDDAGTRDDEVRIILKQLQPVLAETDSIPVIIGGDFNVYSHLDWTVATRDMYNHGGAVVRWTVSREMENAGFKDSFREIHPNPVKDPGATWLYDADVAETPNRFDRIDFIYYQGKTIKARTAEIHNHRLGELYRFRGEDFFYPSDHGFVLTTFAIREK